MDDDGVGRTAQLDGKLVKVGPGEVLLGGKRNSIGLGALLGSVKGI